MSSSSKTAPLEWRFSQVFGDRLADEPYHDDDLISAIAFGNKGNFIAVGDHGGRIIIFERSNAKDMRPRKELETMDSAICPHSRYSYKTEFQSHEMEFDYLKSLEIREKINKLRWWWAFPNISNFILSTNDRTIKLWKITDHKVKKVKEVDPIPHAYSENALLAEKSFTSGQNELSVPNIPLLEWVAKKPRNTSPTSKESPGKVINFSEGPSARCRRMYSQAHDYNINSISTNSDYETFISADDLRINLWNVEVSDQCFNIVDMKPVDMEDLVEVITSVEFHPNYCNLLAYSSSRGLIRLVDMRQSALYDRNATILQDREVHGARTFFTEIIASISDVKFTTDGGYILSRDYMNLKLWDMRIENSPVATFKIHEHLRPKISKLYNDDFIFDKFDCCPSMDGQHFATGTYSNNFKVFSRDGHDGITLEARRTTNRSSHPQNATKQARILPSFARGLNRRGPDTPNSDIDEISCDLSSKVSHLAWHPTENLIACAAKCSLYLFYA